MLITSVKLKPSTVCHSLSLFIAKIYICVDIYFHMYFIFIDIQYIQHTKPVNQHRISLMAIATLGLYTQWLGIQCAAIHCCVCVKT